LCIAARFSRSDCTPLSVLPFLSTRRPPRSTLFPTRRSSDLHSKGNYIISLANLCRWLASQATSMGVEIYPGFAGSSVLKNEKDEDRKSTRLNSSHVKISYAVFCLKKKKQNNTAAAPKRPARK